MPHTKDYFLSQPHQPFFLLGVIWAIVSLLIFGLAYKGVLSLLVPVAEFHSYSLIFIVFTHFFVGFLFTTFPRFCQSEVITKNYYLRVFYLMQAGGLIFTLGSLLHVSLMLLGNGVLFGANVMIVYKLYSIYISSRLAHYNSDPFWILIGFALSLLAHILFLINFFVPSGFLFTLAVQVGVYHYLVFVAFSVAQRMIPFFSHCMIEKQKHFTATIFALLVLKSLSALATLYYLEIAIDILLAGYMLREFLRWKLPVFQSPSILWVLHLALFWLPAGLIIGALANVASQLSSNSFVAMQTHLIALGFITTVLIGFGTRVTLGHSGQAPHADRFATNIFWSVQILVIARVLYSIQSGLNLNLFWLFDLSITLWIGIFAVWSWRYAPVLYSGKKL